MLEPQTMSPGSIMPAYGWLFDDRVDMQSIPGKIHAMRTLGVPYTKEEADNAAADALAQGNKIKENLKKDKISTPADAEIVALIAYLQRLGTDIKASQVAENK
jgi:cytochrome c oxidase cbb3-type subunit I/II